jgi:hypothetical protein
MKEMAMSEIKEDVQQYIDMCREAQSQISLFIPIKKADYFIKDEGIFFEETLDARADSSGALSKMKSPSKSVLLPRLEDLRESKVFTNSYLAQWDSFQSLESPRFEIEEARRLAFILLKEGHLHWKNGKWTPTE